jgi:hypothetical protein
MFHHSGVEGRPRNESRRDGIFIDRDLQNVSKLCRSEMVLVQVSSMEQDVAPDGA